MDQTPTLDEILKDESIKFCYIYKTTGGYYRPNSCGYTGRLEDAGVYEKAEAVQDAKSCEHLRIIPIDVEKHNAHIQKRMKKLAMNKIQTISPNTLLLDTDLPVKVLNNIGWYFYKHGNSNGSLGRTWKVERLGRIRKRELLGLRNAGKTTLSEIERVCELAGITLKN